MPSEELSGFQLKVPTFYNSDGTINETVENRPTSSTKNGAWLRKNVYFNRTFEFNEDDDQIALASEYSDYLSTFDNKAIFIPFKIANWSSPDTPEAFTTEVKVEKYYKPIKAVTNLHINSFIYVPYNPDDFGSGYKTLPGENPLISDGIINVKVVSLLNGDSQTYTNASALVISSKNLLTTPSSDNYNMNGFNPDDGVVYKLKIIFRSLQGSKRIIGGLDFYVTCYLTKFREPQFNENGTGSYNKIFLTNRLAVLDLKPENFIYDDPFNGVWLTGLIENSSSEIDANGDWVYVDDDFEKPNIDYWFMRNSIASNEKNKIALVFKLFGFKDFNNITFKLYHNKNKYRDNGISYKIPFNFTSEWLENAELINPNSILNSFTSEIVDGILKINFFTDTKIFNERSEFSVVVLKNNVEIFCLPLLLTKTLNEKDNFYYYDIDISFDGRNLVNNGFFTSSRTLQANFLNVGYSDQIVEFEKPTNIFTYLTGYKYNTEVSNNANVFVENNYDNWYSSSILLKDSTVDFSIDLKINNYSDFDGVVLIGNSSISNNINLVDYEDFVYYSSVDPGPLFENRLSYVNIIEDGGKHYLKVQLNSIIPSNFSTLHKKCILMLKKNSRYLNCLELEIKVIKILEKQGDEFVEVEYKILQCYLKNYDEGHYQHFETMRSQAPLEEQINSNYKVAINFHDVLVGGNSVVFTVTTKFRENENPKSLYFTIGEGGSQANYFLLNGGGTATSSGYFTMVGNTGTFTLTLTNTDDAPYGYYQREVTVKIYDTPFYEQNKGKLFLAESQTITYYQPKDSY